MGGLVVDVDSEPGVAPVHKLDCPLDGSVEVFGNHFAAEEESTLLTQQVLAMARIALGHHLIGGLEAFAGDLSHG